MSELAGRGATQRDVAVAAGVSVATVSLALSHHARIPERTRRKVLEAAERLGYVPSVRLSAFARTRWAKGSEDRQALLAVLRTGERAQQEFLEQNLLSARSPAAAEAARHGYRLVVVDIVQTRGEALLEKLRFLNADGVLIPMAPPLPEEVYRVVEGYPCLAMATMTHGLRVPLVDSDAFTHAVEAFQRILAAGYRRTGIVVLDVPTSRGQLARIGGALAAREEVAGEVESLPVLKWDPGNVAAMSAYLKAHRPDSLLVHDARWLPALREAGADIPAKIGLAAVMTFESMGVSGMAHDGVLYVRRVFDLMDTMIRNQVTGKDLASLREMIKFKWAEGKTLPPKKKSGRPRSRKRTE